MSANSPEPRSGRREEAPSASPKSWSLLTSAATVTASAPPVLGGSASPRWRRWAWLAVAVAAVAALAVLFGFNPAQHSFYPFCAFHRMSGMQCPGCGGLRAAHHLLHGEVVTAFRFNQLVVLAVPFVVWFALRRVLRGPRPGKISHRAQARWAWIALAVLVIFWIVRNLPLEIFRLPEG